MKTKKEGEWEVQKMEVGNESEYTVKEFAACAQTVFGNQVRTECVQSAFKNKGICKSTVKEAKRIVEEFMKREVK